MKSRKNRVKSCKSCINRVKVPGGKKCLGSRIPGSRILCRPACLHLHLQWPFQVTFPRNCLFQPGWCSLRTVKWPPRLSSCYCLAFPRDGRGNEAKSCLANFFLWIWFSILEFMQWASFAYQVQKKLDFWNNKNGKDKLSSLRGVWGVSGVCLGVVWVTLDSGYCLRVTKPNQLIKKHPFNQQVLFLPVACNWPKCSISGCLEAGRCLEGV